MRLMLLTTAQMKACHEHDQTKDLKMKSRKMHREFVNKWKILGLTIDQHLDW